MDNLGPDWDQRVRRPNPTAPSPDPAFPCVARSGGHDKRVRRSGGQGSRVQISPARL